MKKFLVLAGLTASLGAYAAVPTDAQPFQVVVPNLKSGIEVTLEGLLLRPSNSDLDYVTVTQPTLTTTGGGLPIVFNNSQSISQTSPNFNFGFRVGLGYIFPDSGNDVQLNWTHFNHSDDDTTTAGPGQALLTDLGTPLINLETSLVIGDIVIANNEVPTATSSADFKYDAVDLDAGQYIDVGTRLRMRLFGGLRFARVESDRSDNYSASYNVFGPDEDDPDDQELIGTLLYNESDTLDSKFSGVGPRMGIDTSYHLGNCFGVIGHFAGALLVGNTKTTTNSATQLSFDPTPGVLFEGTQSTSSENNETRVVPAFDAKLGLDYTYIFANQSMLSLELGYQWTQYIDAVDRLNANIIPGVISRSTSSVGFDGPYLTLNWKV